MTSPAITPLARTITQEKINRYAEAVGDFNPIHVDEEFAAGTPFGGTIAHGMLLLAWVSDMMERALGETWARSGRLRARFKAPARPGDVLTIEAARRTEGAWEVACRNQRDEVVLTASASIAEGSR